MNDGGAAFPVPAVYDGSRENCFPSGAYGASEGMALRDYFAAKAMAAIISTGSHPRVDPTSPIQPDDLSDESYRIADAMLVAREKKADA